MTFVARDYQDLIMEHQQRLPREAVWSFMGSGKTVSTLTAHIDLDAVTPGPLLVVGPLRVIQSTWPDEVAKWPHLQRHYEVSVITGSAKEREAALRRDANLFTVNYEQLEWLVAHHVEGGRKWPFRKIVADEATRLKSFRTRQGGKRAAALNRVAGAAWHFNQLTGTPAPNGVQDLWAQAYFLDKGERLGRTFSAFTQRWFYPHPSGYGVVPRESAQFEIQERLRDLCITIDGKDFLDLDEPIVNVIPVDLPAKAMQQYREMEHKMFLELEGVEIEAFNAAGRTIKSLQLCLAESTPTLTHRGWVPIEKLRAGDFLWDGEEWCAFREVVRKGEAEVVQCYGVWMTPEHSVLTAEGWKTAKEILSVEQNQRPLREDVWIPEGAGACGAHYGGQEAGSLETPVRMREHRNPNYNKPSVPQSRNLEVLRMPPRGDVATGLADPRDDESPWVAYLGGDASKVQQPEQQRLAQLRSQGRDCLRALVRVFQELLGGYGPLLETGVVIGPDRQRPGVQPRQLPLGHRCSTSKQPSRHSDASHPARGDVSGRRRARLWAEVCDVVEASCQVVGREGAHTPRKVQVYDVIDAGPRNRYVVKGTDGSPLIVHNCNGAAYLDDTGERWAETHDAKLKALESVVAEAGGPVLVAYHFKSDLERLTKAFPKGRVLDKNPKTIRDWNAGKIPLLFAHPQSAGHGLNLQDGGNVLCFFGLWWALEEHLQIIERIGPARQKQSGHNRPTYVHYLIARGTVDELVLKRLQTKASVQDVLLQAMKERKK